MWKLYFHEASTNKNILIQKNVKTHLADETLHTLKIAFPSWEIEYVDGIPTLYNPETGDCFCILPRT